MAHQGGIREYFRHRPTGRTLVLIVCLKLFVMFVILRLFFFQPALAGMDETQKADAVGSHIATNHNSDNRELHE